MEKIKKLLLFITLISFLYSCGGASDAAKVLRNEKIRNTDEFFVKKRDPLILPPDHTTLPEPYTKGALKKKTVMIKLVKFSKSQKRKTLFLDLRQ